MKKFFVCSVRTKLIEYEFGLVLYILTKFG